jgi:hypothetical protein
VGSVTLFQSRNYKLCVSLGVSSAILSPVRAIFDTGAGPNIVRADLLPAGWEKLLVQNQPLPRITNASGKKMPVRGVIILYVQVGDLRTRVGFYVVPGLGIPCTLGCNFIDLHVQSIHPKEKRVDLREGGSVAITTDTRMSSAASTSSREPTLSRKIRLARLTTIPARSEAHIEVTSACHGLFFVVHHSKTSAPPITLAGGVAEIRSHVPFRVRVINPTLRPHVLQKGMVIGLAEPHPTRIIEVADTPAEAESVLSLDTTLAEERQPAAMDSHIGVNAPTGRPEEYIPLVTVETPTIGSDPD